MADAPADPAADSTRPAVPDAGAAPGLPPVTPGFTDHVFARPHDVELPLRFWPGGEGTRPWLIWFHGGGFVGGKWSTPHAWIVPAFTARGYHVVSVGYRLAPEASLSDQLDDAVQAHAWAVQHLPVEGGRCVAGGDSSGSILGLLAGFAYSPRPAAILNLYGCADMLDPVWRAPPADGGDSYMLNLGDEELERMTRARDPAAALVQCPWEHEIPPAVPLAATRAHLGQRGFEVDDAVRRRIDLATYMYAHARLPDALYRRERFGSEAEMLAAAEELSPLQMVQKVETYPPTYIMHGTKDTCVPLRESTEFAARLREIGVAVAEDYPEAGHVFDTWRSPDEDGWQRHVPPCLDFLDKHVK
ncbi:hypothetical protein Q8F55_002705 [Vanrija albida]|uniref:Alpha/beta hydrolase fold-3 domain-containing protein n=1 Tax=Vanrija albida TaxID=181172 RepID=A0ABR3QAK3_9TREE